MSDTVKLIIEITKEHYEATKKLDKKYPYMLAGGETAIAHGIPLDDVKAEIDKVYEDLDGYDPHALGTFANMISNIFDNIGKTESEVKPNE